MLWTGEGISSVLYYLIVSKTHTVGGEKVEGRAVKVVRQVRREGQRGSSAGA